MERMKRMTSSGGGIVFEEANSLSRPKFGNFLHSDPIMSSSVSNEEDYSNRNSYYSNRDSCASAMSAESSPYNMSPWNQTASPYTKSPWSKSSPAPPSDHQPQPNPPNTLIGSLVREQGHIYSLAASGDLLYTGSDSKNIRVWKNHKEFSGFKSSSGLVKAIVISGDRIFTGHQDGKIRIWKVSAKNPTAHKRVGSLPKLKDYIKKSMKPSSYVEVRRHKNKVWIKHFDAISCLSLNEDQGLLYSGSWDKTFKVWRISDSKCLESINAHDDAVNSVVSAFDGLVFTGSADGSVKVWRRELQGKGTKHFFLQTLLKRDCAVTALAVNPSATVVYSGSSDGVVNYWEREMHLTHGGELKGHKQAVLCMVTAGDLLFTGSADKNICIWTREAGGHLCLSVLSAHTGPVKCLAVEREHHDSEHSEGTGRWILYSGSLDKSVKVWKVGDQANDFHKMASLKQPRGEPFIPDDFTDSYPSSQCFSSSPSLRQW